MGWRDFSIGRRFSFEVKRLKSIAAGLVRDQEITLTVGARIEFLLSRRLIADGAEAFVACGRIALLKRNSSMSQRRQQQW